MSTQSVGSSTTSATSSSQYSTGDQLTSLGSGSPLQVTGLASGLDTNAIVTALMATQQQQVTNLTNQQTGLTAMNTQLTSIQAALSKVATDAQALGNPSLFAYTQTITSTNPTLVGATATSNNGAVVGGYQVSVSAAGERVPADVPVHEPDLGRHDHDRRPADLAGGRRLRPGPRQRDQLQPERQRLGDRDGLAERAAPPPSCCPTARRARPTPPATSSTSATRAARSPSRLSSRRPASTPQYTINGGATQYSSSNTISGAAVTGTPNSTTNPGATQTIPGVSLSLNGVTGSTPVTVTVGSPAPSTQNIQTAVQQFITDYNSAISQIQTQLTQAPSSSDPTQGTLFGDSDLQQLLSNMREQMDATVGGLTGSITSMLNIGVSTGAASGTAAPSQSSISGNLTLDATALTQALTSNSSAVHRCFRAGRSTSRSWSTTRRRPAARSPRGSRATTPRSATSANQIDNLNTANAQKQTELVQRVRADGGDAVLQPVDEQLADQPDRRPADRNSNSERPALTKRPERLKSPRRLPSIWRGRTRSSNPPRRPPTMTPSPATPNAPTAKARC